MIIVSQFQKASGSKKYIGTQLQGYKQQTVAVAITTPSTDSKLSAR